MGMTVTVKNGLLEGTYDIETSCTHVSLHTAAPGTDGSSEVSGGSYARQAITWGDAASGAKPSAAQISFTVPSSANVTHIGLWDASTSGNFQGGDALDDEQDFPTGGTLKFAAGDISVTLADAA